MIDQDPYKPQNSTAPVSSPWKRISQTQKQGSGGIPPQDSTFSSKPANTSPISTNPPSPVEKKAPASSKSASQPPVQPASIPSIKSNNQKMEEDEKSGDKPKKKARFPLKYLLGGLIVVLLVVGAVAGLYLTQIGQDIRQQAAPYCGGALASCSDSQPCCGGFACQGPEGNRKCQATVQDVCSGGGSCTGYYSFQCSSLAVTPESSGVPVCQANPQFHGTDRNSAISRASATGCGQWDQVCVGGDRNGQLCGDFAIINNSCGGTAPPPSATPTPTPTPSTNAFLCTKKTYANESTNTAGNYRFVTEKSTFAPGEIVAFRIVVRNRGTQTLTIDLRDQLGTMLDYGTLLDHSCPGGQVNSNNLLQCDFNVPPGEFQTVGIRLQLNNNIVNGSSFTNRSRAIVGQDVEVCDAKVNIQSSLVGPMCLDIDMIDPVSNLVLTADPEYGDTVKFTCAQVAGVDHYTFRVIEPDRNIVTLSATGQISSSYSISKSGQFYAQCQVCSGPSNSTCSPFESYPDL